MSQTDTRWPENDIRFWAKVEPEPMSGCWLWIAAIMSKGYGMFSYPCGRPKFCLILAHRYAWEHTFGPIPRGKFVCHHCDVRSCVNPQHLFLGTNFDNAHDAMAKGRIRRGERHGMVRLSNNEVFEIRRLWQPGNERALALQFHVSYSAIQLIIKRKRWGWL